MTVALAAVPDPDDESSGESTIYIRPTDEPEAGWTPLESADLNPDTGDRFRAPTLPPWLRDAETRREVLTAEGPQIARWAAWTFTGGLLVAWWRLVTCSPTALRRAASTWWHWAIDDHRYADAREDLHASGTGDANEIQAGHQARQRAHLATSLALVVVASAAIWWHIYRTALTSNAWLIGGLAVALPLVGWAGRDRDSRPLFDALKVEASTAPPITIDLIVAALNAIGIVKDKGQRPRVIQPPARTRTGWETIIDLPPGKDVAQVVKLRNRFAAALQRRAEVVWLSEDTGHDSHAGRLRIVVNRRALRDQPMPEWPWLHGGRFNYFTDAVPVGLDALGEVVAARKAYRSTVYGGIMGAGKTVSMLNAVLAQAVDPRVELHIYDLKGGTDWEPLTAIAHTTIIGTEPEAEDAMLADLRALNRRMEARFKKLRGLTERTPKTTDALASQPDLDLHPIIAVIDETQEAFEFSRHRDEYRDLVSRIVKRGRGVAMTVEAGTQEVKQATLPIAPLCHFRHCMAVTGHQAVDLVLGTGAYSAGYHADALTAEDVGIGYFGSGKVMTIARSYFLDAEALDGDQVQMVCERLRAERENLGLLTGMAAGDDGPDSTIDTILDHVGSVGPLPDRIHGQDLTVLLAEQHAQYEGVDPSRVLALLRDHGVDSRQIETEVIYGPDAGHRKNRNGIRRDDFENVWRAHLARRTADTQLDTEADNEADIEADFADDEADTWSDK